MVNKVTSIFQPRGAAAYEGPLNIKGYTLVLPSISYGNVGQLAVDLLLSTCHVVDPVTRIIKNKKDVSTFSSNSTCSASFREHGISLEDGSRSSPCIVSREDNNFELMGCLNSGSLIPVVGPNPFGNSTICTAADVYVNHGLKCVIVQLRSAIIKGHTKEFIAELLDWIKASGVSVIVCLSSAFSFARSDADLSANSQVRWATTPAGVESSLGVEFDKKFTDSMKYHPECSDISKLAIPGGGFAGELFRTCCSNEVACLLLLRYCSEGDNAPDAIDLANNLVSCVSILNPGELSKHKSREPSTLIDYDDEQDGIFSTNRKMFKPEMFNWTIPPSWKLLYGCRVPESLNAL